MDEELPCPEDCDPQAIPTEPECSSDPSVGGQGASCDDPVHVALCPGADPLEVTIVGGLTLDLSGSELNITPDGPIVAQICSGCRPGILIGITDGGVASWVSHDLGDGIASGVPASFHFGECGPVRSQSGCIKNADGEIVAPYCMEYRICDATVVPVQWFDPVSGHPIVAPNVEGMTLEPCLTSEPKTRKVSCWADAPPAVDGARTFPAGEFTYAAGVVLADPACATGDGVKLETTKPDGSTATTVFAPGERWSIGDPDCCDGYPLKVKIVGLTTVQAKKCVEVACSAEEGN